MYRIPAVVQKTHEVSEPLARGGFGTVYLARQIELDQPVVIEILDPAGLA